MTLTSFAFGSAGRALLAVLLIAGAAAIVAALLPEQRLPAWLHARFGGQTFRQELERAGSPAWLPIVLLCVFATLGAFFRELMALLLPTGLGAWAGLHGFWIWRSRRATGGGSARVARG